MDALWYELPTAERYEISCKFDRVSVQQWDLSLRTLNPLLRNNRDSTIGEVVRADSSIAAMRGIGAAALAELNEKVRQILSDPENAYVELFSSGGVSDTQGFPRQQDLPQERAALADQLEGVPLSKLHLALRTVNPILNAKPRASVADIIRAGDQIGQVRGLGTKALDEINKIVVQLLNNEDDVVKLVSQSPKRNEVDLPTPLAALESIRSEPELGAVPLGLLHLSNRLYRRVDEMGCKRLGDLVRLLDPAKYTPTSLMQLHRAELEDKLSHLVAAYRPGVEHAEGEDARSLLTHDPGGPSGPSVLSSSIDWFAFLASIGIEVVPTGAQPYTRVEDLIRALPQLVEASVTYKQDERRWLIFQRRFGLGGTEKLTLDELASAFGVSRERIRVLEQDVLDYLIVLLVERNYSGKTYHAHPQLLWLMEAMQGLWTGDRTILQSDLRREVSEALGTPLPVDPVHLNMLMALVGVQKIEFGDGDLEPAWTAASKDDIARIREYVEGLHDVLGDNARGLSELDLLVKMNKGREKTGRLSLEQLRSMMQLCSTLERREDGTVQKRFEFLQGRMNQAERILLENGGILELGALHREMNHRLLLHGRKQIDKRNLSNQMASDARFAAIGSSGHWSLKSMLRDNTSTDSVLNLMQRCLLLANKALSAHDIYTYVSGLRPVSEKSITIYLGQRVELFRRAGHDRWELASWPETETGVPSNTSQIADFIDQFFKKRKLAEVPYKELREALMHATGVTERRAQGLLNSNPAIRTRAEGEHRFAIFQPNYSEKIKAGLKKVRKAPTQRDKVAEVARAVLEGMPGKEMPLPDLITELMKTHGFAKPTLYMYLRELDFIELVDVPRASFKLSRIRGAQTPIANKQAFPRIDEIQSTELRENVGRAVEQLTEQNVDVGLFMLGKEFETTLKAYMIEARDKGRFAATLDKDPGRWKLVQMIDVAKKEGIISDGSFLHFLREERNFRAHGATPSLQERKILMANAPFVAALYIDYIKLFEDLRDKL